MEVKATDLCIVNGFRLTEYHILDGSEIVDTYFNIRDEQGKVQGLNYDYVDRPLDIILSM